MEQNLFNNSDQPSSLFQMNLDAQNSYNLRSSISWAKVLGVVGIILGIIICILSFITISKLSGYNDYGYRRGGMDMLGSSLGATRTGLWIMVITGIIFIFGGVFAFNFGNRVGAALRANDQQSLNQGFAALRNYFAIRSITLIILLLLFLISFASNI
jgi:hypothetical protein